MKTTRSEKVYSRWLRLYPRAFREEYGEAMLQHFRDQLRDAQQRGGVGTFALFWLSLFADTCVAALRARFAREKATRAGASAGVRIPSFGFLFVAFLLPLLTGVAIYLVRQPTEFMAITRFLITKKGEVGFKHDPYIVQTQFEVIKSTAVLQEVVTGLGLEKRFMERGARGPDNSRLGVSGAVEVLRNHIQLRTNRNLNGLLQLCVFSEDAGEAAEVANRILTSYLMVKRREHLNALRDLINEGSAIPETPPFPPEALRPDLQLQILDNAARPLRPISPNVPAILTLGGLLSVLLSAAAAWLMRWVLRSRGGTSESVAA